MTKQKEITRDYKFSDGKLKQKADLVILNIGRVKDKADFAGRAVDQTTMDDFQILIDNFDACPDDVEMRGTESEATDDKNAKAEALRVAIRSVRIMAENQFGTENAAYKKYGFERLNNEPDDVLHRLARTVIRVSPTQLAILSKEGLNQQKIDDIETLDKLFDDSIDALGAADGDRDEATQDRIIKGNAVYKEMVRLCNIGKDLYAATDEARYNDYVIYKTKTGEAPEEGTEFGSLSGTITDGDTNEPIADVEITLSGTGITDIVVQADENGEYEVESAPVEITSIKAMMFGYALYTAPLTIPPGGDVIHDIILSPEPAPEP